VVAVDVYVRSRAKKPSQPCGDSFWYAEEGERLWLTVVDGLGSGLEAAAAAVTAIDEIRLQVATAHEREGLDMESFLERLLRKCDQDLHGMRGAALGLASVHARGGRGWYTGVGNVEFRVIGARAVHFPSVPGIVGAGLRRVRVEAFDYAPGDLLVMHSDGISSRFSLPPRGLDAFHLEAIGEGIVAEHGKSHDDMMLVLAVQHG